MNTQPRGDAAGMRYAASQLRAKADRVIAVAARLEGQVAAMSFAGPAAVQFRGVIGDQVRRQREAARILNEMAAALSNGAAAVEADPIGFYNPGGGA
jgi:uncharacterized protein YukE